MTFVPFRAEAERWRKGFVNDKRESNLEMLRLFSALLIIMYHYTATITFEDSSIVANRLTYCLLGLWGGLGVDLFIMISAWFLSKENVKFSVSKIWDLSKIVILYSLIWYVGLVFHGDVGISLKWILKMVLSPFIGTYWFVTAFIIFYMLCPLLNFFVIKMSNNQLKKTTIILTVAVCVYHTVFGGETALMGVISTFAYLFVLMTYLRRTPNNRIERHCGAIALSSYIVLVCMYYYLSKSGRGGVAERFVDRSSIILILLATAVFYMFKKMKFRNGFVNFLAGSVFSIYILHQFWWGWHYIWEVAGVVSAYKNNAFPLHMIVTSFVIFTICASIDFVRRGINKCIRKTALSRKVYGLMEKIDKEINLQGDNCEG